MDYLYYILRVVIQRKCAIKRIIVRHQYIPISKRFLVVTVKQKETMDESGEEVPRRANKRCVLLVTVTVAVVCLVGVVIGVSVHFSGGNEEQSKVEALTQGEDKVVIPTEESFGTLKDGTKIKRFTFKNKNNITIRVISFGATITDILLPDRNGSIKDISLGFDTAAEYEDRHTYIGAALGRTTERIAGASFIIDGTRYNISANDGENHLHGGFYGFDSKVFDAKISGDKVVMTYVSPDGEEGYPGTLTAVFTFQFNDANELTLGYKATTTKPTPISLSNHVYFNLGGHDSGNVGDHLLTLNTDSYIPINEAYLPLGDGKIANVDGTLFDMRKPSRIRERIHTVIVACYCFGENGKMKDIGRLEHPASGRSIEVYTTEPGVDVYFSAHMRNNLYAKNGAKYGPFEDGGICLIPIQYPSGVNMPNFPDTIVRPGETYRHTTIYKFGY